MKNQINALIMEAMKNHDSVRTESLRAIKSAFLNWQTSKENAGKELAEADEIQIIKKMVKQRQESVEQYIMLHFMLKSFHMIMVKHLKQ